MKSSAPAIEKVFFLAALISASISIIILIFMIILGLPLFKGGFFLHVLTQPWAPDHQLYGISSMVIGTLAIAFLALLLAFPLSFGTSILISIIKPPILSQLLEKIVQFMTGIPTVVFGFIGIFLLTPFMREHLSRGSGRCILSASLMLAVLIVPTMILFFTNSFDRIPTSWLTAADALGCNQMQKFLYVILPNSLKGLATGTILAMGRAIGDTMIALMMAGNAVAVPHSVLDPARTLTAHIAMVIAADFDSLEFRIIFACGLILYFMILGITLVIRSLNQAAGNQP